MIEHLGAVLPKGKYYIGDPGYVFDKSWDYILEKTDFFRKNKKIFGITNYFVHNTYWGDGTYLDNLGNSYAVSSGLIGIIPFSLIEIDKKLDLKDSFFTIKEFDKLFTVGYYDGEFYFDELKIDTK